MISVEPSLHDLFKTQAMETPDEPAIVFGHERMSYSQLDQATDELGAYFRHCGVSTDVPVGIFMETCPEYIVASIATLKAGGAFMPMALDSPEPVLRAIVAESQPRVVVTNSRHLSRLEGFTGTHMYCPLTVISPGGASMPLRMGPRSPMTTWRSSHTHPARPETRRG